jgi:hypothetical protein
VKVAHNAPARSVGLAEEAYPRPGLLLGKTLDRFARLGVRDRSRDQICESPQARLGVKRQRLGLACGRDQRSPERRPSTTIGAATLERTPSAFAMALTSPVAFVHSSSRAACPGCLSQAAATLRWLPMNPVPPVIATFMYASY